MNWTKQPLGNVAELRLGKMLDEQKNKGQPLPYLGNINVRWGTFELDHLREMRFEENELERYGLKYGDIVMCEGGKPGRCAIWKEAVPGMMIQKALHRIRPHECLDFRYLYYDFLEKGRTGEFAPLFTGATIQHLPGQNLAKIEVAIPPLEVQHRIADILSAYDDLIENNRRRIDLLEQSARLLYKEWFVSLLFPGHEHVKVKDGVPQGWENGKVEDLGEIVTGKTPSTKEQENYGGDIPFVKTPDMHTQIVVTKTEQQLSERGAKLQENKSLPKGAIMVSCIGTVGVVAIAGTPCQTNQQINSLICHDRILNYYAYFALLDLKPYLESMGGGATMPNVNKAKFSAMPIMIPDKKILSLFDEAVDSNFAQIETLSIMNEKLSQARNLLLPRLMNGEIPV